MGAVTAGNPTCLNCNAELHGSFCSSCGQEHFDHEPTLKQLAADAWANAFSLDGKLLQSLIALFRYPGKLTTEFFEGRRQGYVTPFKLYLTCSALYFLVANFSDIQVKITQSGNHREISSKVIQEIAKEGTAFFFGHLSTFYIIMVPLTALSTAFLFRGRKKSLLFHVVFVLHVWSAIFLVGMVVSLLHIKTSFFALFLLVGFVYTTFAAKRTFNAKWVEAGLKGFLFSLGTFFLSVMALVAVVVVIAVKKSSTDPNFSLSGTTTTTSSNNAPR